MAAGTSAKRELRYEHTEPYQKAGRKNVEGRSSRNRQERRDALGES